MSKHMAQINAYNSWTKAWPPTYRFLSYLRQIRSVSDGHSALIEKTEQNWNNQRTLEGNVAHIFTIALNKTYSQDT